MPCHGNRRSGIGREGVMYAMVEMTNTQMVVLRLTGNVAGSEEVRMSGRSREIGRLPRNREGPGLALLRPAIPAGRYLGADHGWQPKII